MTDQPETFLLAVKQKGGKELSGRYEYLPCLARLEYASGQRDFCHAFMFGPQGELLAKEYALDCAHTPKAPKPQPVNRGALALAEVLAKKFLGDDHGEV